MCAQAFTPCALEMGPLEIAQASTGGITGVPPKEEGAAGGAYVAIGTGSTTLVGEGLLQNS